MGRITEDNGKIMGIHLSMYILLGADLPTIMDLVTLNGNRMGI
jgi:hypothetical protein